MARRYAVLARQAFGREFRTARLLRRLLSESGLGVRLVRRAMSSDVAHAAVAAILGMLAFHDYRLPRLLRRWCRGLADGRADTRSRGPSRTSAHTRHG